MIERAIAEMALNAHRDNTSGFGGYGEPVDAIMALTTGLTERDFRVLGWHLLYCAGANQRQREAARHLAGFGDSTGWGITPPEIAVIIRAAIDFALASGSLDLVILRAALAAFDQGGLAVTADRLVELLCWEEQPS